MREAPRAPHLLDWRPASVLLVAGVWSALVLMSVASTVLNAQQDGREVVAAQVLAARSIDWYSCAVFTPLFVWFARRWPLERESWRVRLPLWLLLSALAAPLKFVLQHTALQQWLPEYTSLTLGRMIAFGFVPEVIAFWAMAGVILSVEYHDRWREREVHAAALDRELSEARLEALTAQLQPHFLFNTLQGISTLLYRDTAAADRMLGRLSELLRRTLRSGQSAEVTLAEEIDTLEHYLEIQRIRFQDRLRIELHANGLEDALLPHLVLQPLVENAIRHGVARRAGAGTIRISARAHGWRLVLEVQDDGPAASMGVAASSSGIGLANTRARLRTLYGADAAVHTAAGADGGFTVRLELPLRRSADAVAV